MYNTALFAVVILAFGLVARFFQRWWHFRTALRGLPQPPHSMIWGHLKLFGEVQASMPDDFPAQSLTEVIRKKYNLPHIFYMDMWPAADAFMVVSDPTVADQLTSKEAGLRKHDATRKYLRPIAGWDTNLVLSEGSEWKRRRAVFNPGFSVQHLMSMVPMLVPLVERFREIMVKKAKKQELFRLQQPCTRLTIDFIGKIVLDHDFDSQRSESPLVSAFESQVRWLPMGWQHRPSELWDIRGPYYLWKNSRIMNSYIRKLLYERFRTIKSRGRQKYVIDLALEAYMKETQGGMSKDEMGELPAGFVNDAIDEIKIFMFAGHDTTSATIAYAFHELARHPDKIMKIRAEHEEVLGSDESKAGELIKQDPIILNKLEYTAAVIKEVLRLHPPGSSVREGDPNVVVRDPHTGQHLRMTKNMMVFVTLPALHCNSEAWGSTAEDFIPERHLTTKAAENDLSFNASAFQPFSKGPRNCIGQELANIEAKIILAMTLRLFDVRLAYNEVQKLKGDGSTYPSTNTGKGMEDPTYPVQMGTAKPNEGMPCQIRLREQL